MNIRKSAEDYLEAMLMIKNRRGFCRSIDVAEQLGVTKPSVSYATKRLRESGYISMDKDGFISLLEPGMEIAGRIYKRHQVLTNCLKLLGVNDADAAEDACRLEHDISDATFEALCRHMEEQGFQIP